jgi:hypothetical protein
MVNDAMMKYYDPIHFDAKELVPPEIYDQLGEKSLLVMDKETLITADKIREHFGVPMVINNWHTGGDRKYSAYRPFNCNVGAMYSQHKFGRAIDAILLNLYALDVRLEIIKNREKFPFITVLEDGVSWLHFDTRCSANGSINLINPN